MIGQTSTPGRTDRLLIDPACRGPAELEVDAELAVAVADIRRQAQDAEQVDLGLDGRLDLGG
jgi:hypothetical protein